MKYSNVFVIAVLVSIAAAGLVCFADDAEATPSNSGEAFVEDASTLLKETIGDDIAKVHYLEGGVIEIVADPSYITLLSANTTELKEKAYNTFIQYDAFYLDGTYFVKDHVPDVPTGTAKALAIAGQAFYKLCNSEPGTIAVYESTEFSITKRGYEPFEGQIVVKVVANQKDIDFANYVSTMVGIDPEKGDIYVSIMVRNLEDRTSVRDALGWLASLTATEFFGPTYAGYVNAICDKLSRVPNAINSASFVWEVDGEKFIISVDGFKPGEGEDPFQKLARGLYDSIADPIPGYSNGWDEPISTFKNDITGDYVASGEALADYHVGNGTVVTLRANVDTTVGPLYKNSGQAFVEDMNRLFKETVGTDLVKGTYSDERLDFYVDYSVFNGEVKITKKAEQMAEYILSKYTKFNVNGTDYVIDGKPVASSAKQLLLELAGMVNNVRNATPGYTEVFVSDSFVVDHSLYPEYTGAIALTTTLDQRSIDFANYITKIVSLDPATGLVTVNVTVYGLDTEYTAKDLAYIYSHTTADMVFDARYSDMINLICDAILDASAASEVPSIVWNLDGTDYKLSLRSFVPGEGKDCFQQLMAGIYNSINDSPAGFENGWDVPVSAFYDEATGNYVADGYAVLSVPTPDGVRELSLPVHANLTASDYPYNITIPDVDHATIIVVPGIDPGKVAIVVIPEDGYEVDTITVTIGDKVIDITDGGVFDLTGDAVVNVKVVKRVTGVTLNRSSATVYQGETFSLTATVLPADATDRSVTWSTSNASVATVSNGVVRAVGLGTATITVTTVDGGKTATCVVNVIINPVIPVTGVTLDKSSVTLRVGQISTLTATVIPATATEKSVTWSTSDVSVATVSNGVVKAVAPGTAIITVTTVDGAKAATCSVTVLPNVVPVEGVTLNHGSMTLDVGQRYTLTATVSPANATNKSVTWSTSNASVATVSNGVVTAVAPGTAIITVTTVDGGKTATCAVTVVKPVVPVTGVALDKEALSLMCGETASLVATVAPGNATDKSVEWSSSNPAVATVDQNGLVTAVAVGEAVITVKTVDGGKTATCAVTVTELVVPVTGVNIEPIEATVIVGNKVTLTATVLPDNATDKSVTWTSSDASVASVDKNGVVTANAVGTATITVKTVDGGFSAECKITVINDPVVHVTGVTLDKSSASLKVGESITLNATVLPDNASNKKVTWTSSNTKVITVDQNGVVKAVAPGNATVSVITEDGSHTANCSFTVTEEPQPSSDNTLLYVGIAAAIILIILAAIFLMRRK